MSQNAFDPSFQPVVRPGEVVKIISGPTDKDVLKVVRVKYIEPIPQKVYDFGPIAGPGSVSGVEVTDLYVNASEFAQYRMLLLDDITVTVSQPPSKTRYATKAFASFLSALISQIAPQLSQVFVLEYQQIKFTVNNPSYQGRGMNKILYYGWRYIFDVIWDSTTAGTTLPPAIPATVIPVQGA